MKIERALKIVASKGRRMPVPIAPLYPSSCTVWNGTPGDIVQEAVYFAYSAGLIKIGYSMQAKARLLELSAGAAMPVTMVLIVPGNEADEREFHRRFAEDRAHHEWFRLSKRLRDFFRARLCPVGRSSLKAAEAEFHEYCLRMGDPRP